MKYGIYSGNIGKGQFTVIGTPEPREGLYLSSFEGRWVIEMSRRTQTGDEHKESSVLELPREYLL